VLPGVQPESGNALFITTQFDVFVTWPQSGGMTFGGGGTGKGAFREQLAAITTNAIQIRRVCRNVISGVL